MTQAANGEPLDDQVNRAALEHERRERAWTPLARWNAIQETIRWAEAQATVRRNMPRSCLERERLLAHRLQCNDEGR
jgi:hypothetical protein